MPRGDQGAPVPHYVHCNSSVGNSSAQGKGTDECDRRTVRVVCVRTMLMLVWEVQDRTHRVRCWACLFGFKLRLLHSGPCFCVL